VCVSVGVYMNVAVEEFVMGVADAHPNKYVTQSNTHTHTTTTTTTATATTK